MAYKIDYGSTKRNKEKWRIVRFFVLTIVFFSLFLMISWQLAPVQIEALRQMLFPENNVDALLQDLREGQSISDAVSAFCQGIFNGN